jgi:DNA-binding NarL/FixJ family response regulator
MKYIGRMAFVLLVVAKTTTTDTCSDLAYLVGARAAGYPLGAVPSERYSVPMHASNCQEVRKVTSPDLLTKRECDILALLAQGKTNRAIANTLTITEATVENYLHTIYQKLNVLNRTEAAIYALRHGLVVDP